MDDDPKTINIFVHTPTPAGPVLARRRATTDAAAPRVRVASFMGPGFSVEQDESGCHVYRHGVETTDLALITDAIGGVVATSQVPMMVQLAELRADENIPFDPGTVYPPDQGVRKA